MSRRRAARPRSKRRAGRQSLSTLLKAADSNARSRSRALNRRKFTRDQQTSKFQAIAETVPEPITTLPAHHRLVRWFIALCLLPFCFITTQTLFQRVSDPSVLEPFWRSAEFWYFCIGLLIMAGYFFTKVAHGTFLYLYVLGHELTHALFVYLSFGSVAGMSVTRQGGYVITNKSNIVIALSPYFVPFWTTVLLAIAVPVDLFLPGIPHYEKVLFFGIGATWGFHLLWTLWMIPRDQPDLKENDTIFSIVLIYLVNIIVVTALACFATDRLSWHEIAHGYLQNGRQLFELAQTVILRR